MKSSPVQKNSTPPNSTTITTLQPLQLLQPLQPTTLLFILPPLRVDIRCNINTLCHDVPLLNYLNLNNISILLKISHQIR